MAKEISAHTALYALIGSPVAHSLSPAMHNYSFRACGIDAVYLAFDVTEKDLPKAVDAMRALGIRGYNVTMPLKTAVMDHLDEIDEQAALVGAVNTITNEDGRLKGYSTDGEGFVRNLKSHGIEVHGKRIALAGAGGAARSILSSLCRHGAAQVTLLKRRNAGFADAEQMLKRQASFAPDTTLSIEETEAADEVALDAEIFINATNVGMRPHEDRSILTAAAFHEGLVVADAVYDPLETKLLREAKEAGLTTVDGRGMLLWQGAVAFHLFTGSEMPVKEVEEMFFS